MPADLPAQARDAGASVVPAPAVTPAGSLTENVRAGKPERSVEGVTYTLQIGEYVTPQAMEEAKRKIKKAGLEPVVEQGAKRKGPMIRLSAGDYPTLEAAKKQINKLHEAKVDGFFLLGGDKRYHVYVGSYADEKSAAAEGSRLAALGIKSSMKRVVVPVSTFKLTAGSFPTRAAAMAMAEELEKQGVHSVPVERALPGKLP
jgi:cell division protein FtsN